jgi:glycerophosphoryl diester phosphodiesterase
MDYLIVRKPYLLAHRGASGYAPENTPSAFERAVALRADGIETDVRASKDGALVLFHDERIDRVTDGDGRVADLTLAELRALDAGASFNHRFAGERIATLDQLLDPFGGRLPICLEIKHPGIEKAVVAEVQKRELLKPTPKVELQSRIQIALPPVHFTSFSFESCLALKKEAPEALIGFLTPAFDDLTIKRVADAGLGQICPRADACTREQVLRANDRGLSVRAWGVSDRELLRQALDAGAEGATCNWPDWTVTPSR